MSLRSPALWRRLALRVALGVLLWGLCLPTASAQQVRTLNIHDGTIYVDGQPLPEDQLPEGLSLEGVNARYRFLGIQRPVIELDGRLYAVEDGLTPVTEEEVRKQQASVILGSPARTSRDGRDRATVQRSIGHKQYLSAIERSSRELYQRLLRERRMERSARNLAHAIRLLPAGPERQAQIDTLRVMLEEIFELKQENRRREIERLRRQIQELNQNLQRRARMREQMIDRRLRQLVDSTRSQ